MRTENEAILETKLNILIDDFKRFREEQREVNKELTTHGTSETQVQAKILTTLKWHTAIGGFMMATIMALVYDRFTGG